MTPNSRSDRYLKGQKDAINANEIAGYELFKKYDCATCHVGEILGGQSYELIGVQHDYFANRQAEMTEEDISSNFHRKYADLTEPPTSGNLLPAT